METGLKSCASCVHLVLSISKMQLRKKYLLWHYTNDESHTFKFDHECVSSVLHKLRRILWRPTPKITERVFNKKLSQKSTRRGRNCIFSNYSFFRTPHVPPCLSTTTNLYSGYLGSNCALFHNWSLKGLIPPTLLDKNKIHVCIMLCHQRINIIIHMDNKTQFRANTSQHSTLTCYACQYNILHNNFLFWLFSPLFSSRSSAHHHIRPFSLDFIRGLYL